jgi:hypothetical protein
LAKRYLTKQAVAFRYCCDTRTVDRMKDDGRLPKPVYLPNNKRPFWLEADLDRHDKKATVERPATGVEA